MNRVLHFSSGHYTVIAAWIESTCTRFSPCYELVGHRLVSMPQPTVELLPTLLNWQWCVKNLHMHPSIDQLGVINRQNCQGMPLKRTTLLQCHKTCENKWTAKCIWYKYSTDTRYSSVHSCSIRKYYILSLKHQQMQDPDIVCSMVTTLLLWCTLGTYNNISHMFTFTVVSFLNTKETVELLFVLAGWFSFFFVVFIWGGGGAQYYNWLCECHFFRYYFWNYVAVWKQWYYWNFLQNRIPIKFLYSYVFHNIFIYFHNIHIICYRHWQVLSSQIPFGKMQRNSLSRKQLFFSNYDLIALTFYANISFLVLAVPLR